MNEKQKISKELVANTLRWTNNILVEILSNHAGPYFPKTAVTLREITRLLSLAQNDLYEDTYSANKTTFASDNRNRNDSGVSGRRIIE